MVNLIYMAKPRFGGWVTFTAHLSRKYNYKLYKIHTKTEKKKDGSPVLRDYGYGVKYQNISIEDAAKLKDIMITAIDKNYYKYLDKFPSRRTTLVIHDPTEVKGKSTQPVIDNLKRFKIVTIRETVKKHLKNTFKVNSTFKLHPFFEYDITKNSNEKAVAISRVDFDKHTDIIIKANNELTENDEDDKIVDIYGAKNDLYVFHHLQNKLKLNLDDYYKGTFKKDFSDLDNVLSEAKYMIDLSAIHNDGGGSQYTFLEAIYQGAALVLNEKWVANTNSVFKDKYNCFVVKDEKDLVKLLKKWPSVNKIRSNAKKLLAPHIDVIW